MRRETVNRIRYVLEDIVPPVLRDSILFRWIATLAWGAALCLYALASGLWIHVLTRVDLVRAYPFAALSFVLVPLFSYLCLGERIGAPYAAGVALTALGVVLCQH